MMLKEGDESEGMDLLATFMALILSYNVFLIILVEFCHGGDEADIPDQQFGSSVSCATLFAEHTSNPSVSEWDLASVQFSQENSDPAVECLRFETFYSYVLVPVVGLDVWFG